MAETTEARWLVCHHCGQTVRAGEPWCPHCDVPTPGWDGETD